MAIGLLQELQSSVLPGPRYGPVGGRRLKSGLFNWYVIFGISEVFGHNHADLQSVTPALAHDPSVNYSTAPRPKRRGFKFEKIREKDATGSRKKRLGYRPQAALKGFPSLQPRQWGPIWDSRHVKCCLLAQHPKYAGSRPAPIFSGHKVCLLANFSMHLAPAATPRRDVCTLSGQQ
jgi:hypothetical protein